MVLQGCTPPSHIPRHFDVSASMVGTTQIPAPAPSRRTLEAAITRTYTKVADIAAVAAWLTEARPHSQLSKVGSSSREM